MAPGACRTAGLMVGVELVIENGAPVVSIRRSPAEAARENFARTDYIHNESLGAREQNSRVSTRAPPVDLWRNQASRVCKVMNRSCAVAHESSEVFK